MELLNDILHKKKYLKIYLYLYISFLFSTNLT